MAAKNVLQFREISGVQSKRQGLKCTSIAILNCDRKICSQTWQQALDQLQQTSIKFF